MCFDSLFLLPDWGLVFALVSLLLLSHFSHVRLCDPIDVSPPGSPIPGILQARVLEWGAIAFSVGFYKTL